jgi:Ca2+-binding RTX toxin-like protein
MDIGVNLAAITYWSTEEPFIDHFHTAGQWSARNSSGSDVTSTLSFSSDGDPIYSSTVTTLGVAVGVDPKSAEPTDQYVLTYQGTAGKISIANATIVSQTAGKVVFNYTGGDSKPDVYFTFQGLNASNPVSEVHVVRADQVDAFNAGEIFNPAFLEKVSEWGVVRFMDWGNTNNSESLSWATRTTLDDAQWSKVNADGVPLEAMVKLANEAHVDMWYNVPTRADDTYVKNALTYIRDHLDPDLQVHVEWSNEVWNKSFIANSYAQNRANALWGNGSTVSNGANIYYGYRSAQISDMAHDIFTGTHAGQLVDVLAGQAANSGLMTYMLQGIAKAGLGSVSDLFAEYAIAPYFGAELSASGTNSTDRATILNWASSGSAGLDAAFHELEYGGSLSKDQSLAVVENWITKSGATAAANGLDLVAYEGGASLDTMIYSTTYRATVQAFFGQLMNDPRMGDLYTKLVEDFKAAGGTDFIAFNDISTNSTSGYYGLLDSIYDTSSPRYDALLAAIQAEQDASGPSSVPTTGNDQLFATSLGGTIDALAGDDTITAGSGSDTIDGNDGNDLINGASATNQSDYYYGGAGADTIAGGAGNDHIWGNESTSTIGAADGGDSLSGGDGTDMIRGNAGNDTIDGGNGNDQLYGGEDNDSLIGGAGNDYMQGDSGNDVVIAGIGNDTLHGGAGDDTLSGNDGNDILLGDQGHDRMTGGAGNDIFSFGVGHATFTTTGTTAYVTDEITDFTIGADKLSLGFHPAEILHGSASTVAEALSWATQALQAHAGTADVAAVSVGSDTFLFYDDAGKGGAVDSAIHLDNVGGSLVSTADFV